jgi:hypothetical protein
MIGNENVGKSSSIFSCEKCGFYTVKKFNYDKHILTSKHLKSIFVNENVGKSSKNKHKYNSLWFLFLRDSLSPFSDLLFYIFFFSKTFFGNLKMDKKNVQISKMEINVQISKTVRP